MNTLQPFSDQHRLFVQSLLARPFLPESDAIDIFQKVHEVYNVDCSMSSFPMFLASIQHALDPFGLSIRRSTNERERIVYLGLVNVEADRWAATWTDYASNETSFLKIAIDAIVGAKNEQFLVKGLDLLKETARVKPPLKKVAAEQALAKFVQDGWLVYESSGTYELGLRTVMELQTYLKESFEEAIRVCFFCKDIVTRGELCSSSECRGAAHWHCSAHVFQNGMNKECRECGSPLVERCDYRVRESPRRKRARSPSQS